jgi:hypothetical protein
MAVVTIQEFTVYLFSEGQHKDADGKLTVVRTTLAELPTKIEKMREARTACCWEAYNDQDVCITYRQCKGA